MEPYYYAAMSPAEKTAYHAMKTGFLSLAGSFRVPKMEGRELAEVFFRMRLDCPELFFATGYRCRSYRESEYLEVLPEYLFEKGKLAAHKQAMSARVEKLSRAAKGLSEWEKELYIHDFICESVRYDKLKKPYSHEIIGPLGQGVGVCEGIAKSVKILCDALGIWCVIAISEANPEKGIKYRHAWNVVKLGGSYYHLDATFDNTLSRGGMLRHDYVNLSDSQIYRDHEPAIWRLPVCGDGGHFYYKEKKLSFTKLEEVKRRAEQAARKGKPLLFHWRGGYLTRKLLGEILAILQEAAAARGKRAAAKINWPQAVISVEFGECGESADWVMEEANEGERD